MNREEIIRMAREAGMDAPREIVVNNYWTADYDDIERFAALVEAAVEERLKWDGLHSCHSECDRPACVHTRKAVEAEREACAKVCEEPGWNAANWCAKAIRARGSV